MYVLGHVTSHPIQQKRQHKLPQTSLFDCTNCAICDKDLPEYPRYHHEVGNNEAGAICSGCYVSRHEEFVGEKHGLVFNRGFADKIDQQVDWMINQGNPIQMLVSTAASYASIATSSKSLEPTGGVAAATASICTRRQRPTKVSNSTAPAPSSTPKNSMTGWSYRVSLTPAQTACGHVQQSKHSSAQVPTVFAGPVTGGDLTGNQTTKLIMYGSKYRQTSLMVARTVCALGKVSH